MIYTTSTCQNCGYRVRNHESNVPKVQIGKPIIRCPNCEFLILDTIATEYEFMWDDERWKFTSSSALLRSIPGNIIFIGCGIAFMIGTIVSGTAIAAGVIFGSLLMFLGIFQIIRNISMAKDNVIEQEVYESLKRTENSVYLELLKESYDYNYIDRAYRPFRDKEEFMKKYSYFESRESYIENMAEFYQLVSSITELIAKEQKNSQSNIQL